MSKVLLLRSSSNSLEPFQLAIARSIYSTVSGYSNINFKHYVLDNGDILVKVDAKGCCMHILIGNLKIQSKINSYTLKTPIYRFYDRQNINLFYSEALNVFLDIVAKIQFKEIVRELEIKRKLIITTGDISDVDGFFAVAEYAKHNADILFILNYPAYIGVDDNSKEVELQPGLGFSYSTSAVLRKYVDDALYKKFMQSYRSVSKDSYKMRCAITDIAFWVLRNIWAERRPGMHSNKGLYFCIGGINSVNPFASSVIKNEVADYCSLVSEDINHFHDISEGQVFGMDGTLSSFDTLTYSDIYMDFNGSAAFLTESWKGVMESEPFQSRLRGLFIMGGVEGQVKPVTTPMIPGVLNRFSCATMNQLYHPIRSADLVELSSCGDIYIVANNAVHDLKFDPDGKTNISGVEMFMASNDLDSRFLRRLAYNYYTKKNFPPQKMFDVYTAKILCSVMNGDHVTHEVKHLYTDAERGACIVSEHCDWRCAKEEFIRAISISSGHDDKLKARISPEIEYLTKLNWIQPVIVLNVQPHLEKQSNALVIL